jgi:hypothetical protein
MQELCLPTDDTARGRLAVDYHAHCYKLVDGQAFLDHAAILEAGSVALTVYLTTKATVMKMAVGPEGSRDVEFVEKLAEKFRSERAPIRIQPVITPGAVALADIHGKAPFDLAVVRGNLDLSTDWPVVAILRQDVVVLIVPAPDAYAAKRGRKHGKIEKVSELVGKRVGIVEGTDGGADLLSVILKHYGVPRR